MKSILDRTFTYRNSANTDVRKTFARIRRELRDADEAQARINAEAAAKVSALPGVKRRVAG